MKTMRKLIFVFVALFAAAFLPRHAFSQSGGSNPSVVMYRFNGGNPSPQAVFEGNLLGTVRWDGLTAIGSIRTGASIQSYITGPVSPGVIPANMIFRTGALNQQNRMVITSEGLIGIGTMTPEYHLDIVGNTHTSGDFFGRIHFDNNATTNSAPDSYIDEAYFELKNRSALTGGLALPPSANAQGGLLSLAPGGSSLDHQLFFGDDGIWTRRQTGNAADWVGADWQRVLTGELINGTPNRIAKFTAGNSLGDSQLFDDGTSVGIGTTSPDAAYLLTVGGDTRIDGLLRATGNLSAGGNAVVSGNGAVNGNLGIGTPASAFRLDVNGESNFSQRVKIGAPSFATNFMLNVGGGIMAEEVRVQLQPWPDYVFESSYRLMPLREVETFIQKEKHLPGVAAAKEVAENGLNLGEMQKAQMEKIEELFLHLIELEKRVHDLEARNQALRAENEALKSPAGH
jgi:hypothetical protein